MLHLSIQNATAELLYPFGSYVRLTDMPGRTGEDGWLAWMTTQLCMDSICHMGFGHATAMPFTPRTFSRIAHSQIVFICGNAPLILILSGDPIQPEHLHAFQLTPGDLLTLQPGIWFAAPCSPEGENCYYHFLMKGTTVSETYTFNSGTASLVQ